MTFIAQMLADRMILKPTRHEIAAPGKERRMVPFRKGSLELWTQRVGCSDSDDVDLFVMKFSGQAGRAERSTYHPMDHWPDLRAELWSVNPPGYGGSSGKATLKTMGEAGQAAFEEMLKVAAGRPTIVMGNSLGTVNALYLAANYDVSGMILRNPPPLRQLIVGQYGWWNLWIGAWHVSHKVPRRLCSIRNASRCYCPTVFISSRKDQIVPANYHDRIINAYAGPAKIVTLEKARHATSLNVAQQREYRGQLQWLRSHVVGEPKPEPTMVAAVSS